MRFALAPLALLVACGGHAVTPKAAGGHAATGPAGPAGTAPPRAAATDWRALLGGALPEGCVASNGHEALCILAERSIQAGGTYTLSWVSPAGHEDWPGPTVAAQAFAAEPPLDAETLARVIARLDAGRFAPLGTPLADVPASAPARPVVDAGGLQITWRPTVIEHLDTEEGSWDRTREVLVVTKPRACELPPAELEGVDLSHLRAWPLGDAFLVESHVGWGMEGDRGHEVGAFVIGAAACPKD
jgi:hypothetical protein